MKRKRVATFNDSRLGIRVLVGLLIIFGATWVVNMILGAWLWTRRGKLNEERAV